MFVNSSSWSVRGGDELLGPCRAAQQMQLISLDDTQDMRSQEGQRICVVNIGDSGLRLAFGLFSFFLWVFWWFCLVGFVFFM